MQQALNMRKFQPDDDLLRIADARPGQIAKHDGKAANVTIYTIPPSLCSQRVRMTLMEKSVPYHEYTVDFARGENLEPAYIALNPRALVPTMTFEERVLFDSATMMRFINNYFFGPELAPSDEQSFAKMGEWMRRSDEFPIRGFHYRSHLATGRPDYVRVAMRDNILRAREHYPQYRDLYDLKLRDWQDLEDWIASPSDITEGVRIATGIADDAEEALRDARPFLLGDQITLADITIVVLFVRLQCGCDVQLWGRHLRPALHEYVERMKRRPSYDGAILEPYRKNDLVEFSGNCWLPADLEKA